MMSYGSTILLVILSLSLWFCEALSSNSEDIQLSNFEKAELVHTLNVFRRQVNSGSMKCLRYNETVALAAHQWAAQCQAGLNEPENQGQIIVVAQAELGKTAPDRVNIKQKLCHRFQLGAQKFKQLGNSAACDENAACSSYKRMMTERSGDVGCAMVKCGNIAGYNQPGIVVVCNFAGPSFDASGAPFVLGRQCSACEKGTERCLNGLCCASSQNTNFRFRATTVRALCQPEVLTATKTTTMTTTTITTTSSSTTTTTSTSTSITTTTSTSTSITTTTTSQTTTKWPQDIYNGPLNTRDAVVGALDSYSLQSSRDAVVGPIPNKDTATAPHRNTDSEVEIVLPRGEAAAPSPPTASGDEGKQRNPDSEVEMLPAIDNTTASNINDAHEGKQRNPDSEVEMLPAIDNTTASNINDADECSIGKRKVFCSFSFDKGYCSSEAYGSLTISACPKTCSRTCPGMELSTGNVADECAAGNRSAFCLFAYAKGYCDHPTFATDTKTACPRTCARICPDMTPTSNPTGPGQQQPTVVNPPVPPAVNPALPSAVNPPPAVNPMSPGQPPINPQKPDYSQQLQDSECSNNNHTALCRMIELTGSCALERIFENSVASLCPRTCGVGDSCQQQPTSGDNQYTDLFPILATGAIGAAVALFSQPQQNAKNAGMFPSTPSYQTNSFIQPSQLPVIGLPVYPGALGSQTTCVDHDPDYCGLLVSMGACNSAFFVNEARSTCPVGCGLSPCVQGQFPTQSPIQRQNSRFPCPDSSRVICQMFAGFGFCQNRFMFNQARDLCPQTCGIPAFCTPGIAGSESLPFA